VTASLGLFERAALTGAIQPRTGATPFVSFGSGPVLWLAAGMLLLGLMLGLRSRHTS
jgi:apolipoprotein N-acyltransferase